MILQPVPRQISGPVEIIDRVLRQAQVPRRTPEFSRSPPPFSSIPLIIVRPSILYNGASTTIVRYLRESVG